MRNKRIIFVLLLMLSLMACTPSDTETAAAIPSAAAVATTSAEPTAEPTPTSLPHVHVEHNGISLAYDPALFGDEVIQDVPASANLGLFDQPSPAHTRIGFASSDIVHDPAFPWRLTTLEPNIAIYNLNDFGSYAIGDRYARAQITEFQELLDKRPSPITETIPVILHVNAGQIIRAQVKWLDFGNGAGVRFLTQYDQAPSPIHNEGLVYIFQGVTEDGLHGVTAVFPLDAAFLPDGFEMDEAAFTTFIENFDAEMTAVIQRLDAAPDSDFNPPLSQLDALVQSISVLPTETDFPMTTHEPQYGRALATADIFDAPDGREVIGSLPADETVIMNAASEDGRYRRILCPDGSTGSCWVAAEVIVETESEAGPVFYAGGTPVEGDVVGITAVSTNPIYDGPGETYRRVGELASSESAAVLGSEVTKQWLAIECPRGIGVACWVTSETAVNEPTTFVLGAEAEATAEELAAADCPEAAAGAHQLIDAANGICFLYPDNYDVFQGEDGSLTLYVRSLLNTEAPLATVRVEVINGRSIQEIIPDYPSDADLAAMSFLTIELGGEQATVLDNLPGQDTNRRVIAIHYDRIVDIMIARIGEDYGEVGQQAEALYQMITETFQFIGVEPQAPLLAGPECPEATADLALFTNEEDGFCLLLPTEYEVQISDGQTAVYINSLMNVTDPRLFINVEDANGRTLADVTTAKQEEFAGFEVMYSFGYMLDGVPADQFEQLPGQDLNRQVIAVHNGRLYTLTFIPDDPTMAEVYTEMQALYDTVMDSFSFLHES